MYMKEKQNELRNLRLEALQEGKFSFFGFVFIPFHLDNFFGVKAAKENDDYDDDNFVLEDEEVGINPGFLRKIKKKPKKKKSDVMAKQKVAFMKKSLKVKNAFAVFRFILFLLF